MSSNLVLQKAPSHDPQTADSLESKLAQFEQLAQFDNQLKFAPNKAKFFRELVAAKGTQHMVSIDDIRVMEGFNPRIKDEGYYQHIRSIANSILSEGFYPDKPLTAVPSYEGKRCIALITDGACRLAGALLAISEGAPLEHLPIVFKDESTTQDDLIVALVKSNEGKRFTPLELSVVVKRLFKFGHSISKIAKRLGITTEYVSQLLSLAGAPEEIRKMLEGGTISAGLALQTMRKHGNEAAEVLQDVVQKAQQGGKRTVTTKDMPDHVDRKILVKSAPVMKTAFESIRTHQDYASVPESIRKMVEDVLIGMEEAKTKALDKANKAAAKSAAAETKDEAVSQAE